MEYKGYNITAEVETYEKWEIDEDGRPKEFIADIDYFEVSGYFFDNSETGDTFFQEGHELGLESLKELVDERVKELAK